MNMTRINYAVCIHRWVSICGPLMQLFSKKMKDFFKVRRPLEAVTYIVKVVVLKTSCKIDTLLLHTTNSKYHTCTAYLFVLFPMTLVDLEGHSRDAGLIKCNAIFRTVQPCDVWLWDRQTDTSPTHKRLPLEAADFENVVHYSNISQALTWSPLTRSVW